MQFQAIDTSSALGAVSTAAGPDRADDPVVDRRSKLHALACSSSGVRHELLLLVTMHSPVAFVLIRADAETMKR